MAAGPPRGRPAHRRPPAESVPVVRSNSAPRRLGDSADSAQAAQPTVAAQPICCDFSRAFSRFRRNHLRLRSWPAAISRQEKSCHDLS